MFQPWRLELRRARAALAEGQLEEADRLLRQGDLRQYQPARQLSAQIAQGYEQRARQHAAAGNSTAGWRDWRSAKELAGDTREVVSLKGELAAKSLEHISQHLAAGDIEGALKRLHRLEERHGPNEQLRSWRQAAMRLKAAQGLARRGRFEQAEAHLAAAAEIASGWQVLKKWKKLYVARRREMAPLEKRLATEWQRGRWPRVIAIAQRMLELAPEHKMAQRARYQAWDEISATGLLECSLPAASESQDENDNHAGSPRAAGERVQRQPPMSKPQSITSPQRGQRYHLWIDAVGGYLVCLGEEISLGQAVPAAAVDVPIMAELSRRHARVRRAGEGYVIEPFSKVSVNNEPIAAATPLNDGDEIEMGGGVKLRFRQPHPLSTSARLDFLSRHRTQPSVTGVLLFAESCVLGPHTTNHVVCRDWPRDVVLFRQGGELHCRAEGELEINGAPTQGGGPLGQEGHVASDHFSFSIEEA